jgi:hypothetical protein
MDSVKRMIGAGANLSMAIKQELGMSVTAFADKFDLARTITSEVLNLDRAPRMDVCRALASELGGEPYEWAVLLWEAAKPQPARFIAA